MDYMKWRHVAFVYDRHGGEGEYNDRQRGLARVYVNGELNAEDTAQSPYSLRGTEKNIVIGHTPGYTRNVEPAYAVVDEIRIWDRVLTGEEILENMNRELDGDEDGLIAYWNFNGILE